MKSLRFMMKQKTLEKSKAVGFVKYAPIGERVNCDENLNWRLLGGTGIAVKGLE